MTRYTDEQLSSFPWIVSEATFRPDDLLPAFWGVAERLGATIDADTLAGLSCLVGEDSRETDWDDEAAAETLERLEGILQDAAPTGFYFGSNEGDGACFGFWLSEDWETALSDAGILPDDPEPTASLVRDLDDEGVTPDNLSDAMVGTATGWSEEKAGADYAQTLFEELNDFRELRWPFTCIDWEDAWQELRSNDGYSLIELGRSGEWAVIGNF